MSTTTTPLPTIAFLGATGLCTAHALNLALRAGNPCVALARTPAKLLALLAAAPFSLSPALLAAPHLVVVEGNAQDSAAVRAVLFPASLGGRAVALAVLGVGGVGQLKMDLRAPFVLPDPRVCASAAETLISVLRTGLREGDARPVVVAVSSTGIATESGGREDVPLPIRAVYKWSLTMPHKDKKEMEGVLANAATEGVCSGLVLVRPTLLTDSEGRGLGDEGVKEGWEWVGGGEGAPGPAVGYSVARADVGTWMYERVLKTGGEGWLGKAVTLTN